MLALVTALATGGARPFLLVPGTPHPPNVAGDAAAWWRQLATVSDVVLEVYASAPKIYPAGALSARARCASSFRDALQAFLAISVPPGASG